MKNLKGTKTEKNLLESFANESMASMRYRIFEKVAKKEGYKQTQDFFEEASDEEYGHAKLWYALLNGGELPTTKDNIKVAIDAENEEWTNSYEAMARVAREEGFEEIAKHFEKVAKEEEGHEGHLHELLNEEPKKEKCCCKNCD